jgi:hypothetical protein
VCVPPPKKSVAYTGAAKRQTKEKKKYIPIIYAYIKKKKQSVAYTGAANNVCMHVLLGLAKKTLLSEKKNTLRPDTGIATPAAR